jgi:hypothetical protein
MFRPASAPLLFGLCCADYLQAQTTVYQGTRESVTYTSQSVKACPTLTSPITVTSTLVGLTLSVPNNSVGCPAVTFGGTITLNHSSPLSATVNGTVVTITTTPRPSWKRPFKEPRRC